MNIKKFIYTTTLAAFIVLTGGKAGAFDLIRTGANYLYWPDNKIPVEYKINSIGSADIGNFEDQTAIQNSFKAWENVACSYIEFKYDGTTSKREASIFDGENIITWIETDWPDELGPSTVGVTTPAFYPDGTIDDADIRFNGQDFCWSITGSKTCMDVANVATHEIGHFIGLGHEDKISDATMFPSGDNGETKCATLHQDDINGVCFIYPSYDGSTGSPCDDSHSCIGDNVCVSHGDRTVCSQKCGDGEACPSGFTCDDEDDACVPKSNVGMASGSGGDISKGAICYSCTMGADCNSGLCIQFPSMTICSQICDMNDDNCPTDYTCTQLSISEAACFPSDGMCPPGGEESSGEKGDYCGATGYCNYNLVCVSTDVDEAYCYTICQSDRDCETGEECYELIDENDNYIGYGACWDNGDSNDDDEDDDDDETGGSGGSSASDETWGTYDDDDDLFNEGPQRYTKPEEGGCGCRVSRI